METNEIFEKIQNECTKQDIKWGIRNMHPASWFLILNEEIGEAAMEVNDASHITSQMNLEQYEMELIQSAAVIIQMIKNIKHYEMDKKWFSAYEDNVKYTNNDE